MTEKQRPGIFEAAYHVMASYMTNSKQTTRAIMPTCLDDYIREAYKKSTGPLYIERPQLFLVDPIKTSLEIDTYWGMLSYSPNRTNIIGSIFHMPYNDDIGAEIACGLILDPHSIAVVYATFDPYEFSSGRLNFTHGDIADDYKLLSDIFDDQEAHDFTSLIVETVHTLLVHEIVPGDLYL